MSSPCTHALAMTSDVVRYIGARGHIQERMLDKLAKKNNEDEIEIE